MKSNAPWSVKGIERDARETAKEAAKREGMTVGEWLNQMIYSAGDPESSGGHVEGLKLRDIVTAIDHLHKRIADSSTETGAAVTDVSRKMGDIVERVQRLERSKPGGGERDRIDALKSLEKAVSQVAVQFSNAQKTTLERLDATETSLKKLTAQVISSRGDGDDASNVGVLKDTVDALQTRMARTERLASEAAKGQAGGGDPEFIESTSNRLRVLGDEIKRGGDQIRTLESTIGKLSQQIEAAERRSAEGVQKTAETLAELREQFAGGSFESLDKDDISAVVTEHLRETTDRLDRLQTSVESMNVGANAHVDDTADAPHQPFSAYSATEDTEDDDVTALAEPEESADLDDLSLNDTAELDQIDDSPSDDSDLPEEAKAADSDDDLDDDDDFFSFSDEIDASIEEDSSSEREDGFSFELDDAESGDDDTEQTGSAIAEDVSTAHSAFSDNALSDNETGADEDDNAESTIEDPEKASVDRELDELLAGLDDIGETKSDDEDATEAESQDTAEPVAEKGAVSPSKEDLLKSIRRKAREEAATRESNDDDNDDEARPTRRKLTPKQKAILAARARRKRLAEQKGEDADDAAKAEATKKALEASAQHDDEDAVESRDDEGDGQEDNGRFASLRGKFPFFGGNKDNDNDDAEAFDAHVADGDQEALETLKSTASARPVTLALGVGIFLAIGLVAFALKDFIFSPRGDVATGTSTATVEPAAPAAEPTLEAPEPPAVDPKTLYRDAMTGLNAAGNDAETNVAIEKLEQAALLGHPPAQLQLGELYKTGQGVDQDLAQARTWFRRAANGGNVLAMHRVGVMTARGEGGSANTPEAINWFEQAANRGLVDSQYNLGAIYHPSGEGETGASEFQDAGKAYYWYSLAAKNGDEQAGPLASGVGAALSETQRADLDEAIAGWAATPADIEANTLATAG